MYIILTVVLLCVLLLALNPEVISGKPDPGYDPENKFLSFWNKGICITGPNKRMSLKAAYRHILVCGQSGVGKSQCSFLPELLRADGSKSYIVHDISGEIEKACGAHLSKKHNIFTLDLDSAYSNFYNPLQRIDESFSAAKRVASIIVSSSLGENNGDGKFFNIKAEHFLSVFIALTKQLKPEEQHMGSVLKLINTFSSSPSSMDVFAADKAAKAPKVFEEYKTIIATDPKLLSNIVSTAKAAISLFEDENIMQLTARDDISFEDLRRKPTVIFLRSSVMTLRYNQPLFSLVITQAMSALLAKLPSKADLPVVMLLDEMGILKLPNFSDFLSNSRKYKVCCVLGCQTTSMIINKYGKEEGNNILANCATHLYYGNQPIETALILERMAGTVEVETRGKIEKRTVLQAHHIRTLDPTRAILMTSGCKPIMVKLLPAYKNYVLKKRMEQPYKRNLPEITKEEIPLPFIPKPKRVKE